jgi:hypothetical protein
MAGVGVVASCVSILDAAAISIGAEWKDARRRDLIGINGSAAR